VGEKKGDGVGKWKLILEKRWGIMVFLRVIIRCGFWNYLVD
jgi:hypothetical protein